MAYKEIFWMACDSTEQLRAEYGPFHTRAEAEAEAHKLDSAIIALRALLDENEEILEVRCIFLELPGAPVAEGSGFSLHTRCATCGASATHDKAWRAESGRTFTNSNTHAISFGFSSMREARD